MSLYRLTSRFSIHLNFYSNFPFNCSGQTKKNTKKQKTQKQTKKTPHFIKLILCPLKVCVNIDITLKNPLAFSKRNPCNVRKQGVTYRDHLAAEWILSLSGKKTKLNFLITAFKKWRIRKNSLCFLKAFKFFKHLETVGISARPSNARIKSQVILQKLICNSIACKFWHNYHS